MSKDLWNERFGGKEYAYGTDPNTFLAEAAGQIPPGPVLCLAEGEGRNAVFLAGRGHAVTAVDWSEAGLAKARALASRSRVEIRTVLADLHDHSVEPGAWAGIVLIFAHLPPPLRTRLHRECVEGLAPGGVLILEAYGKAQAAYDTGGPKDPDLLMTMTQVLEDFSGLDTVHAAETVRPVIEGRHHRGRAAVVQYIGRKPAAGQL